MKTRFHSSDHISDEMALQITSMADIFTIILVFLLKSYATSTVNIQPSPGMQIPEAKAEQSQIQALKLEISEGSILVESKPITKLESFQFPTGDLQNNHTSRSVNTALEIEHKRQLLISQANPSVKADSKIMIIADRRTPYSTVKSVLASAALNGFSDFKLVVVEKE